MVRLKDYAVVSPIKRVVLSVEDYLPATLEMRAVNFWKKIIRYRTGATNILHYG